MSKFILSCIVLCLVSLFVLSVFVAKLNPLFGFLLLACSTLFSVLTYDINVSASLSSANLLKIEQTKLLISFNQAQHDENIKNIKHAKTRVNE